MPTPRPRLRGRANLARIASLDPVRDFEEIYRMHATLEFPWEITRALELALFRTYAVPTVGELLDATQEFAQRTQKRYDDTTVLLSVPFEDGLDSMTGREALSRVNRIHARFDISDDDFRYVLSTFVVVPLRFLDRYGWRPVTEVERIATYEYWAAVGRRMNIRDVPTSLEQMIAEGDDYEARTFAVNDASRRVGIATRELLVSWFPYVPKPVTRTAVHALLDAPTRTAMSLPAAPSPVRALVEGALRLRGLALRALPERTKPVRISEGRFVRSQPVGRVLSLLGPDGAPLPGASEPKVRAGNV